MSEENAHWAVQTVEPPSGVNTSGKAVIIFYARQVKNNFESKKQQRPVFVERVFIKKIVGGDNLLLHDQPMRDEDKEKYAMEWERWEKTRSTAIPGIPIENWHSISDTQKAEFRALNIFTIEQFAGLPDSLAGKIMGFHALRQKAQVFVASGKDAELMSRIRAEADEKLNAQQSQIDALMAKITEMQAASVKPPRPRKKLLQQRQPVTA